MYLHSEKKGTKAVNGVTTFQKIQLCTLFNPKRCILVPSEVFCPSEHPSVAFPGEIVLFYLLSYLFLFWVSKAIWHGLAMPSHWLNNTARVLQVCTINRRSQQASANRQLAKLAWAECSKSQHSDALHRVWLHPSTHHHQQPLQHMCSY